MSSLANLERQGGGSNQYAKYVQGTIAHSVQQKYNFNGVKKGDLIFLQIGNIWTSGNFQLPFFSQVENINELAVREIAIGGSTASTATGVKYALLEATDNNCAVTINPANSAAIFYYAPVAPTIL